MVFRVYVGVAQLRSWACLLSFVVVSHVLIGEDIPVNPSVIGGVISQEGDYPWLGALVSAEASEGESDLTNAQFCGCSLIDENWILTAAHCLDGDTTGEVAVAFGNGDLSGGNRVVPIDLIVIHPDYKDVLGLKHDIALARLAEPVRDIEPIAVNRDSEEVSLGAPVKVIGWGMTAPVQDDPDRTSRLREADLSLLDRDFLNDPELLDGRVSEKMLPVGNLEPFVTSFFGDSGGPMIPQGEENLRLLGVTSWGMGCFIELIPYSIYTDVLPYLDWIDSIVDRDRQDWARASGLDSDSLDDYDVAYRLNQKPSMENVSLLRFEDGAVETQVRVRPFSTDWKYEVSFYQRDVGGWREMEWEMWKGVNEDGSVEVSTPQSIEWNELIVHSKQTRRSTSGGAHLDLALNQVVQGSFGEWESLSEGGVRVFDISGLEARSGYRIALESDGGWMRYWLYSTTDDNALRVQGRVSDRRNLEYWFREGEDYRLFLVPEESNIEFTVALQVEEVSGLQVGSDYRMSDLLDTDPAYTSDGHYVDSYKLSGEGDVMVVLDGQFDSGLMLWDVNRMEELGQSESWGEDVPEYFIFNKAEEESLSLNILNVESGAAGIYEIYVESLDELNELAMDLEFDFRGLTRTDFTEDPFEGFEYVDRVELIGMGVGTRFLTVTGLSSFRPLFALRDMTDDVIVQKFDSAFCFESSVIEFHAQAGHRYEAIVAGSERSLNKNYFLEISTSRPPSPYEQFSNVSSTASERMEKWMERRFGKSAERSSE